MSFGFSNFELQNKTIAIVEDDIPSVRYYETLLMNSGAEVVVFTNGKEFIDWVCSGKKKPDLVIMDFLVPYINGIECTRIFRKERKDIPVLMITAYFSEQSKNEALIAGCDEYVLKPVFPEKVSLLLQKYLKPEKSFSSIT